MRGELLWAEAGPEAYRITPAYAGRTSRRSVLSWRRSDHPRVCGENSASEISAMLWPGSPPRMRGELNERLRRAVGVGITPAYAGRTHAATSWATRTSDHPRVCGENRGDAWGKPFIKGSPPRMRGERPRGSARRPDRRITPAYAGRTCSCRRSTPTLWDHPRVCGENPYSIATKTFAGGSPPRMRGEHAGQGAGCGAGGITPAYAGRTWVGEQGPELVKDHPRVCGENTASGMSGTAQGGSPPRMRGEPAQRIPLAAIGGITPAYAGRTAAPHVELGGDEDHPRVCGENPQQRLASGPTLGSPPRMRGERTTHSCRRPYRGSSQMRV